MKKIVALILSFVLSCVIFAGGLINPTDLNDLMKKDDVVVLDYRWDTVPAATIPGAYVVLNKDVSRNVNGIDGMVLPKGEFETLMSDLGIENNDDIVIVDDEGMMNATRLWWILKLYGHEGDIYVLDGQIMAWEKAGLPMEAPAKPAEKSKYVAKDADPALVAGLDEVKASIDNDKITVIDTRSAMERIKGHIPNSTYIEWKNNITAEGRYKSKEELQKIYADAGVTKDLDAVIPHCKSAVRSTQTMFALVEILGYDNVKNYDGSWIEYGACGAPIQYGLK